MRKTKKKTISPHRQNVVNENAESFIFKESPTHKITNSSGASPIICRKRSKKTTPNCFLNPKSPHKAPQAFPIDCHW
jgi:hypothetical protein